MNNLTLRERHRQVTKERDLLREQLDRLVNKIEETEREKALLKELIKMEKEFTNNLLKERDRRVIK